MKKLILAVLMVSGATITLNAQDTKPVNQGKGKRIQQQALSVDERVKRNSEKVEKELGLTADQKAKWAAAAKERMLANQPIREKLNGSTTPEERKELRQKAKANNDKFDAAVNAFLTPEQKTKFEGMKKNRMDKHKGKGPQKPAEIKEDDVKQLLED